MRSADAVGTVINAVIYGIIYSGASSDPHRRRTHVLQVQWLGSSRPKTGADAAMQIPRSNHILKDRLYRRMRAIVGIL